MTQSEKRLITSIVVLVIFGVLQVVTGLTIPGLLALLGASLVLVVFFVTKGR